MRLGWFKPVHCKSMAAQRGAGRCSARAGHKSQLRKNAQPHAANKTTVVKAHHGEQADQAEMVPGNPTFRTAHGHEGYRLEQRSDAAI
jgi:hypothetical protein